MRIIEGAMKLVEAMAHSQSVRQSRREFFRSVIPWTRGRCKACGETHIAGGGLCPTCAKRLMAK